MLLRINVQVLIDYINENYKIFEDILIEEINYFGDIASSDEAYMLSDLVMNDHGNWFIEENNYDFNLVFESIDQLKYDFTDLIFKLDPNNDK